MQTDEDVGKVAQAVPIIISRTLELFVESLLSKAMQVTLTRNAKTLSPSHVKQCILAESRFDFLRDLVKNIPDVSAAEEKEMMSAESSPNSSRCSEVTAPPRRIAREDSNSSSSSDVRVQPPPIIAPHLKRALSAETEIPHKTPKMETITSPVVSLDTAIDLSKKSTEEKPIRTANFYQETLPEEIPHKSVITVNPTYASPQPSTSYTNLTPIEPVHRIEIPVPKPFEGRSVTPRTPVTPILNIDFTKNLTKPEIKVLDTTAANIMGMPKNDKLKVQRQISKHKEIKKVELKPLAPPLPVDIDRLNSGNLQIDEDYDT
ncbi:hypothetical protein O3G_MSEX003193 [Manduca sexta]|uniref:Transcription factor CBF/NF-Y/archaeal histone domain-containing protein n=2 Tax=Manduca sexta TaxID=7130 RepID=A0A921YT37_MANSE|nr:hypothetical protein O3G_MSEX003193 [Manduca sexta]